MSSPAPQPASAPAATISRLRSNPLVFHRLRSGALNRVALHVRVPFSELSTARRHSWTRYRSSLDQKLSVREAFYFRRASEDGGQSFVSGEMIGEQPIMVTASLSKGGALARREL